MAEKYDNYAEEKVIGQVFNDVRCFDEANLKPEHFFNPIHRTVWAAITELRAKGHAVDPLIVGDILRKRGQLDAVGGYAKLAEFHSDITGNVRYYAESIRDLWQQRQIVNIHSILDKGITASETILQVRKALDAIEQSVGRELPTLHQLLEAEKQAIRDDIESGDHNPNGLLTGLGIEGVVPGGIPRDKVTTLFGESGNFKTTLKNNIIWGIAKNNEGSILDISLEDADELTVQRYIASETEIGYGRIATRDFEDEDLNKVLNLKSTIADRLIMGADIPPDIDEIIRQARYYSRTKNVVACVVDYVQLLEGKDQKALIDEVVRKTQLSAKRDKIAYILVSQVKQDVDYRAQQKQSTRPRITDMIGSSALRFGSKLSIGVYRPYNYEKTPSKNSPWKRLYYEYADGPDIYPMVLELWVVKNVLGEPNVFIPAIVNPATGAMVPLPESLKSLL